MNLNAEIRTRCSSEELDRFEKLVEEIGCSKSFLSRAMINSFMDILAIKGIDAFTFEFRKAKIFENQKGGVINGNKS